jgi:DNA polymerase III subunit delta'
MPKHITPEPPPHRPPPAPFVGHERIVEYFRSIGPAGLAHAYLFHGPRGVGKTTFARTLALTLHCERPTSFPLGFCGTCGPCVRGIAGSSGDTIEVDADFIRAADEAAGGGQRKTDTIGIETSRLIVRRMEMRSYEGGRLVCIIPRFDNVPYGRDEVYNALLKELEEPDPGKLFLLTTERPERILPTIRSRTISLRFDPLDDRVVADALVERHGVDRSAATTLARASMGSIGDALEQRDDGARAMRAAARAWALSCIADPGSLPPIPELGDEPRAALIDVLRDARLAVRDVLARALDPRAEPLDIEGAAEARRTTDALGDAAARRAADALEALLEAERYAATNMSPSVVLGWLQVRLRTLAR